MRRKIIIIICIVLIGTRGALLSFITPQSYATSPFSFNITTDNNWGTGFCYEFITKNTSLTPVSDWVIGFELTGGTMTSSYGGVYSNIGNSYEIRSPGSYADPLPSGSSITMGFCGNGSPSTLVSGLELKGYTGSEGGPVLPGTILQNYNILFDDFQLNVTTNSQYTGGYCRNISIQNTGNNTINGWSLDFSLDQMLTSSYSGNFSKTGIYHNITPLPYNSDITSGQSHVLGFCSEGTKFDFNWSITVNGKTSSNIPSESSNKIGTASVSGSSTFDKDIIWDTYFPGSASGSLLNIKISAQVQPSLNLIISKSTIELGTLEANIPASGSLFLEIGTNARSGASLTARSQSGGLTHTVDNLYQINKLTTDGIAESYIWKSEINPSHDSATQGYIAENTSGNALAHFIEIYENISEYNIYSTNKNEALDGINDVEFIIQAQVNAETPAGEYEDTIHFTITGNF